MHGKLWRKGLSVLRLFDATLFSGNCAHGFMTMVSHNQKYNMGSKVQVESPALSHALNQH
jgi:hypothetical protein